MAKQMYICVNEPYNFGFKATDADGDSLIYKLCVPKAGLTPLRPLSPMSICKGTTLSGISFSNFVQPQQL